MKKLLFLVLAISAFGLSGSAAHATVTVPAGPTALITSPLTAKATSGPIGLFKVTLNQNAGETLSSISLILNQNASSTMTGTDLTSMSVYKDDGNGLFDPSTDLLAGTQSTIAMGATTSVSLTSNNSIASTSSTFFVSIATNGTWSDVAPADSFTATMPNGSIITSTNSPTTSPVTTSSITADTTAPQLLSVVAQNTGGTSAKEPGDSLQFIFSQPTNAPSISSSTIASLFALSNSHSFLDANSQLGSATWNASSTILTVVLSGTSTSTVATVATGDGVSVTTPSPIKDAAGNPAFGTAVIIGNFASQVVPGPIGSGKCSNGLINGRLYKVVGDKKIYLAANCNLKVFNGNAWGRAWGKKFRNIITLPSLNGLTVIAKPKRSNDDVKQHNEELKRQQEVLKEAAKKERERLKELAKHTDDDDDHWSILTTTPSTTPPTARQTDNNNDDDHGKQSKTKQNGQGKKK